MPGRVFAARRLTVDLLVTSLSLADMATHRYTLDQYRHDVGKASLLRRVLSGIGRARYGSRARTARRGPGPAP